MVDANLRAGLAYLFDKHYLEPRFYGDSVLYGSRRNVVLTLSHDG